MKKTIFITLCLLIGITVNAQQVIRVAPENGDMTKKLQTAIEQARNYNGKAVVIKLQNADYNLHRESSSQIVYHISNTASEKENPDQTKHIGLWLKGLKNVTIDGQGARFVTHGEMTSFVIDQCENITLRNFTVTASDPTVPELTVIEVGSNFMTVRIHPQSRYTVKDGHFAFVGDNWTLSDGIAQSYDKEKDITWRSWSPLPDLRKAIELEPNLLRFVYDNPPQVKPGTVFQMRDGIRDQACGLIQYSKNITLDGIHLAFLGNFGIVGQMAENITYRNLTFEPEAGSGRTCAGFADFVQMSGCKGKITIENSRFLGAHDDPINIHGTHLAVTGYPASNQIAVKYMHHQTYGFQSFLPGNEIEFIDPHSLMSLAPAKVKKAEMKNEREILLTLDRNIPQNIREIKELVVENVTYTPEVLIRDNYFARIPTRGILVSTRRKVLIENNTFFRMQMSGILIADDARSWFESGMARDVTIRNNNFIECGGPVILIAPENDRNEGYVHRNIAITNNRFQLTGADAVSAKSVDGLKITDNLFLTPKALTLEDLIKTRECKDVTIDGNIIQ
ncbi:right-handed parallel beta-helix repeat-containing protein [Parabacteroides sp. AF18-52]|jgi:alpha-1,3-galactosidase A|uniref:right-handed parallel beta-helix repeat-containing protein n=1 Tax=Parabacteroides TaxID=375288 RepID=UPI000F004F64|nr:right-handed parallel beta-helix repeat-containing protein [Parabacteroides sp. AF18-52]RHR42064.1 right-handed parallel beta-helix repeat-containing protein [Parabacteroides sp. AF18-52]